MDGARWLAINGKLLAGTALLSLGAVATLAAAALGGSGNILAGLGARAIGTLDKTLRGWDLATGEHLTAFGGEAAFDCCAFAKRLPWRIASDGITVVAGDSLGRVHFLQLENLP